MNDKIPSERTLEILHKEIDLIQNVIDRMASNSFKIKSIAISVTGFSILGITRFSDFVLSQTFIGVFIIIIALLCAIVDCKYLKFERIYRIWYKFIIDNLQSESSNKHLYELNPAVIRKILEANNINVTDKIKGIWHSFAILPLYSIIAVIGIYLLAPRIYFYSLNVLCF
ncbi:MAG: hypothetical protein K0U45_07930 [Alphaproteobacteria bacterium]|nr:hypothetical protein [Alphaproteobacteria bacterium]